MKRWRGVAGALSIWGALAGCGGRQILLLPPDSDAGPPESTAATVGPVDLSQAPRQLTMTCDHAVGELALDNPCLVGNNLLGPTVDIHAVECRLAAPPANPVVFSFVLNLSSVTAHPDVPVEIPHDAPPVPTSGLIDVGGSRRASVSSVVGTLSFSRVDPTNRAFVGHFTGTVFWTETTGSTFSCAVDAPLWGGPGGFN
jgi:hypothetical protein